MTQSTWIAGLMPGELIPTLDDTVVVFVRETPKRLRVRRADGVEVSVHAWWLYGHTLRTGC